MSDHSNAIENQPQIDSRANLFYLLQKLSGLTGEKDRKPCEESSISNHQTETYQKQI